MKPTPSSAARRAAASTPSRRSWSVSATAVHPAAAASSGMRSGGSEPSETVEWVCRSITHAEPRGWRWDTLTTSPCVARRVAANTGGSVVVSARDLDSDGSLVVAAQDGDGDAFAELFRRHYTAVRRTCARRLGDLREADEIAQAAFVRAWERIDRCGGERRF